jgi:hypothetical protein
MCNLGPLECAWPKIDYPSEMIEVEFSTLALNDDFIYNGLWFVKKDEMCAEAMNGEELFDCCELVTIEKK